MRLLEGNRLFPSRNCGVWRVLPADRASVDKRFLLQNAFSNKYLGHDSLGRARCTETLPSPVEHLELEVDEATGLLRIVCPHWHWERGAPLVIKGEGKLNPPLWPVETSFLESVGRFGHSENPCRSLRCGELL